MASEPRDPEREARDRVALRQDRETKALSELQRQERERDSDRQNRALQNSLANQANVEADKEKALAAHEKRWKEASDRLTPRPIPAPGFDMIGPPPSRNLVQDHDEIRQRQDRGARPDRQGLRPTHRRLRNRAGRNAARVRSRQRSPRPGA